MTNDSPENDAGDLVSETSNTYTASPGNPRWVRNWNARKVKVVDLVPGSEFAPRHETTGPYWGLCMLVDFPDVKSQISQDAVHQFCNTPGFRGDRNVGSVYDYFAGISSSKLQYQNIVVPYWTASKPSTYYKDASVHWPDRAQELVAEGLQVLQAQNFDFKPFTVDEHDRIRAISLFYAGARNQELSQGLWPHSSSLDSEIQLSPNRYASNYQISDLGTELSLGTFCHETGHMICDFPDLTGQRLDHTWGVGKYCLMGEGGNEDPKNPIDVCGYLKLKAGWAKTTLITNTPGAYVAAPGDNQVFIYHKNADEYFLIEARHQSGRDSSLPGSGLAIWHVNEFGHNPLPIPGFECSLMQADDSKDLDIGRNSGDADDLYPFNTQIAFGDSTNPNSRWHDGSTSGLEIIDIKRAGRNVEFIVL